MANAVLEQGLGADGGLFNEYNPGDAATRDRFSDRRHGDWFATVDAAGRPRDHEKAGFWKTPYHNARACLEILGRTQDMAC
jgi:mannose/cellobiose epimerase-like protein (N-acyl-D-glucosamine 2-epimerase family)